MMSARVASNERFPSSVEIAAADAASETGATH